ncbi:hypothetical protein AAHC03_012942 [Spirometra sp. Aus1]
MPFALPSTSTCVIVCKGEDFVRNLRAVTFFLRDILLHLRNTAAPGDHGSNCRVLVSCHLPAASTAARSSIVSLPHGLAQTCILQSEGKR